MNVLEKLRVAPIGNRRLVPKNPVMPERTLRGIIRKIQVPVPDLSGIERELEARATLPQSVFRPLQFSDIRDGSHIARQVTLRVHNSFSFADGPRDGAVLVNEAI